MTIKVVKLTHVMVENGIGTQLVYETDGVPMLARFNVKLSESEAVANIEHQRRQLEKGKR